MVLISIVFLSLNTTAQIGIGTNNPDLSTELDVVSPNGNKGLLIPRVSLTADLTNPLPTTNPGVGLMVYNSGNASQEGFYYWSGTSWYRFAASAPGTGEFVQSAIQCYNTMSDVSISTTPVPLRWQATDYEDPSVFRREPAYPQYIYVNYSGVYEVSANINVVLTGSNSAVQFMMRVCINDIPSQRGKSYSSSKENGAKATLSPSPILVTLVAGQRVSVTISQQYLTNNVAINTIIEECTLSLKLVAAD